MNMIRRSNDEGRPITSTFSFTTRGKKIWSSDEDIRLKQLVTTLGTGNWTLIAESLPERTGKQCRERWHNHLGAGIKKGDWTPEEDKIIISMQKTIGNQWAKITRMLPGRTDNAVKNRFHATERAKTKVKGEEGYYSANYSAYGGNAPNLRPTILYPAPTPQTTSIAPDNCISTAADSGNYNNEDNISDISDRDAKMCVAASFAPAANSKQFDGRPGTTGQLSDAAMCNDIKFAPHSQLRHGGGSYEYAAEHGKDDGCGEGDDDDCGGGEGNSMTDLMELDIISFSSDDLRLYDSLAAPVPPPQTRAGNFHHQHDNVPPPKRSMFGFSSGSSRSNNNHRQQSLPYDPNAGEDDGEIDPCCTLFDWNRGGRAPAPSSSSQLHGGGQAESYRYHQAPPPAPHYYQQPPHQHQQQQQFSQHSYHEQQHAQQQYHSGQESRYNCGNGGPDSWNCTSFGQHPHPPRTDGHGAGNNTFEQYSRAFQLQQSQQRQQQSAGPHPPQLQF